ncbi:MAG: flagellar biosynthesis protein FlhB [Burkholderiales bacterium]|nr:MAG: flagellar biosynthesis protein FlhB [Burkholderiales bacterium]
MADENDLERTEPASPRRREEARNQGQVPQSRELVSLAMVGGVGALLWLAGASLVSRVGATLAHGLTVERELAFDAHLLLPRLARLTVEALVALLPIAGAALVCALVAPIALRGWILSAKALTPDWNRLDPVKGLSRMFSLSSLVELAMSVAKALLVGGAGAWALWSQRDTLVGLAFQRPGAAFSSLAAVLVLSFFCLVGAIALVALVDVPFQLWNYGRRLRMSREEVKREHKETEGDPQIKAQVRARQREAARRRMMAEVPKADVVVVNPTHYAAALAYQEGRMRAPRVVAKGAGLLAARIREVAQAHQVPVLSAPALARALYYHAELGEEIPEALYTAVAEVLAYVYQLRHARVYGRALPPFGEVPIPQGMDPHAEDPERKSG